MTLTFDEGKAVIDIRTEADIDYQVSRIRIGFSGAGIVYLTGKELDIFITALQVIAGNR